MNGALWSPDGMMFMLRDAEGYRTDSGVPSPELKPIVVPMR